MSAISVFLRSEIYRQQFKNFVIFLSMNLEEIGIQIGSWLYLQCREEKESAKKTLCVGLRPKKYLVITAPVANFSKKTEEILVYFYNGEKAYEFQTNILEFLKYPVDLILLKYPEYVKLREQRSYKRIRCFVSAKVQYSSENGSELAEGIIKDVSKKGCRIIFPLGKLKKSSFKKDEKILIMLKFPGIPGEQRIYGNIKNVLREKEEISIGIEFDELAWWAPPYY